jgi:O-antigen ligase
VVSAASALSFTVGTIGGGGVERAVSERRVALWTDGVEALAADPWLGSGPRAFRSVSPTAAGDSDTREAHAELLQRAVESGVPGLILEVAALVVLAATLARRAWRNDHPQDARVAAVGLAGVCALWANAGVDWVLAFPAVIGLGTVVAGMAYPRHRGMTKRDRRVTAPSAVRVETLRK